MRSIAPLRLYQQVAEQIAGLIMAGEFQAGDRLPSERELSSKLKVSRPTVREAMIALEIAGHVEVRTGAGIFVRLNANGGGVKRLTLKDAGVGPLELIDARIILETAIAIEAANGCTPEDIAEIQKSIDAMHEATSTDASRSADQSFHVAIAAASRNAVLKELVNELWREMFSPLFERLGYLTGLLTETQNSTVHEHEVICQALTRGDGQAAGLAMKTHLTNVRKTLLDGRMDAGHLGVRGAGDAA